ncbi:MAG: peptide chain release factor N(5)-glutamine methyltransferase [Chloroflexota bacterium]|nr:peptide chain release factor N(5)-glutamine methyltransferase [Chloroflexota bacterium]
MPERPPTYQDVLREGSGRLARAGIETARLDAEVLLRHVAGLDRAGLFLRLPEPVPDGLEARFNELAERRLHGEPVAYIVGRREFMGLPFRVAPGVLIPRPETELLVEWALATIAGGSSGTVVDVGTGSGAIAISIAALGSPATRIIATDVSASALAIARDNAATLLEEAQRSRIEFRQGSLLKPVDEPVDVLLANLPYLTPEQVTGNPDLEAEPRLALDGGADGLDLVRDLIADLPRVLAPNGAIGLELDPSQTGEVAGLLRRSFPDRTIRTIHDLAGLARHMVMDPEPDRMAATRAATTRPD